MHKRFLLSVLCLMMVTRAFCQEGNSYDTSKIKPHHYTGGAILDKIEYQFENPDIKPNGVHGNPYDNIKVPDYSQSPSADKTNEILNRLERAPASKETRSSNTTFDYDKVNADRFLNSPCITQLGFNPEGDVKLQEKMFSDCEKARTNSTIKKLIIIVLLIGGFFGVVIIGLRKKASL